MDCPDDLALPRTAAPAAPVAGWQVHASPGVRPFPVTGGHTLLQAAELAGLDWPSSCRNGTCRTCIQRLAQGAVRYAIDWPGVLAEEKAEGWILPCVAFPISDLVMAQAVTPQETRP